MSINLIIIFVKKIWLCSTMDSIWVSEAYDPGSIPGRATSFFYISSKIKLNFC